MSHERKCRGPRCGARIRFVPLQMDDGSERRVPVDADPIQEPDEVRGHLVECGENGEELYRRARRGDAGPFYRRHHINCPDSGLFRGRR